MIAGTFLRLLVLVATLILFAWFARTVPWTRPAVAFWCTTLIALVWVQVQPGQPARVAAAGIWLAWALVYVLKDRVPLLAWGTARERRCQEVMLRASREAREAYLAGRLGEILDGLIEDLDALNPPPGPWRSAHTAQLLDLRARPPQVGVGEATDRLVPWPWRVALDRRTVRFRVRIDDAVRRRRASRLERPGLDDLPSDQRYDYFFLRIVTARFLRLSDVEAGLVGGSIEAAALIALARDVAPPDSRWTRVRDLVVERLALELRAATDGLEPHELDRLGTVAEESVARWGQLELAFTRRTAAEA